MPAGRSSRGVNLSEQWHELFGGGGEVSGSGTLGRCAGALRGGCKHAGGTARAVPRVRG